MVLNMYVKRRWFCFTFMQKWAKLRLKNGFGWFEFFFGGTGGMKILPHCKRFCWRSHEITKIFNQGHLTKLNVKEKGSACLVSFDGCKKKNGPFCEIFLIFPNWFWHYCPFKNKLECDDFISKKQKKRKKALLLA